MDGINEGFKIIFKFTFLAIIIISSFIIMYYAEEDYKNKFDITINNKEITARYDTEYIKYIFKRYGGST